MLLHETILLTRCGCKKKLGVDLRHPMHLYGNIIRIPLLDKNKLWCSDGPPKQEQCTIREFEFSRKDLIDEDRMSWIYEEKY
tara:strand:- start:160 stop:405 length:246 start_codon:yes stop_codon:yes gene_type:complete